MHLEIGANSAKQCFQDFSIVTSTDLDLQIGLDTGSSVRGARATRCLGRQEVELCMSFGAAPAVFADG